MVEEYKWIESHRNRFIGLKSNTDKYGLYRDVPDNYFNHHFKIFMPYYVNNVTSDATRENENIWITEIHKYDNFVKISPAELCELFKMELTKDFGIGKIRNKLRYIPNSIHLIKEKCISHLHNIFDGLNTTDLIWYAGDTFDGKYDINDEGYESWIHKDNLSFLFDFYIKSPYGLPSYIWDNNKNWLVYSPEIAEDFYILSVNDTHLDYFISRFNNIDYLKLNYDECYY